MMAKLLMFLSGIRKPDLGTVLAGVLILSLEALLVYILDIFRVGMDAEFWEMGLAFVLINCGFYLDYRRQCRKWQAEQRVLDEIRRSIQDCSVR